ncbi:MAG: STAS domain-containing protein, partial [Candidatus Electrothrix sp. AR1]|nr:STAS domain-containing protein [Candidatus Electrothrix sp. AR1]
FGLLIFIGTRRIQHSLTLPGLLLVEGIFFYFLLLFRFSDTSVGAAIEAGFLLGNVGQAGGWPLITPAHISAVDFGALQGQLGNIGAVLIITPITLLLNLTGIEISERKDMDLNYELQAAGKANILSALAGGMIGFHSLGYTLLGRQMTTSRTRVLGLIVGITPLLILFFGLPLLAVMPRGLLGSLLVFQGITFLYNWLIKKWNSLPLVDYGLAIIIGLVIAAAGFMVGIMLGLVIMMITFVISYSRTDIFYRKLSGAEITSRVQRHPRHRKELIRQGRHTHILELHGFIFFGTANAILAELQSRQHTALPLRYLILDFRRVTGVDSSAAFSLVKALNLAKSSGFIVLFSQLSSQLKQQLLCNGIRPGEHLKNFSDLDRALEWCEEALLECNQVTMHNLALPLQLMDSGFSKEQARKVRRYLKKLILAPNDILMRQGETANAFYFIESGRVSIYLEEDGQRTVRLQTLCTGMLVGEVGFCLDIPRSATIIADIDSVAYRFTRTSMKAMQMEEPLLAQAFKKLMFRVVAERLVTANQRVAALDR